MAVQKWWRYRELDTPPTYIEVVKKRNEDAQSTKNTSFAFDPVFLHGKV